MHACKYRQAFCASRQQKIGKYFLCLKTFPSCLVLKGFPCVFVLCDEKRKQKCSKKNSAVLPIPRNPNQIPWLPAESPARTGLQPKAQSSFNRPAATKRMGFEPRPKSRFNRVVAPKGSWSGTPIRSHFNRLAAQNGTGLEPKPNFVSTRQRPS